LINSRKIYLYVKGNNLHDVISFLEIYEEFSIEKTFGHYIELSADAIINIETLMNAREFLVGELFHDFIAFVMPLNFDHIIQDILDIMPDLNPGIYTIDSLIPEIVLRNKVELVKKLKNYYYNKFSPETIDTILGFIEQDLNASQTAKALYMHRNTLNYRLDNFISKTEIDVRRFKGALAIHLLFRR